MPGRRARRGKAPSCCSIMQLKFQAYARKFKGHGSHGNHNLTRPRVQSLALPDPQQPPCSALHWVSIPGGTSPRCSLHPQVPQTELCPGSGPPKPQVFHCKSLWADHLLMDKGSGGGAGGTTSLFSDIWWHHQPPQVGHRTDSRSRGGVAWKC